MHIPVLLEEVIRILDPQPGTRCIDATVGGGGHAAQIATRIAPGGKLLIVDWDGHALQNALPRITRKGITFFSAVANFADLPDVLREKKFGKADRLLFDFGFSSDQIDDSSRGLSFQIDAPLDMRFSMTSNRPTASTIINTARREELENIFRMYGEERFARRIAAQIVVSRRVQPIVRTTQLAALVAGAIPRRTWTRTLHPATRVFQALRIAVNDELANIDRAMRMLPRIVAHRGKVACITFHSLEDRIVKNHFKRYVTEGRGVLLVKKPITPTLNEMRLNPRSRSAKLRAFMFT